MVSRLRDIEEQKERFREEELDFGRILGRGLTAEAHTLIKNLKELRIMEYPNDVRCVRCEE